MDSIYIGRTYGILGWPTYLIFVTYIVQRRPLSNELFVFITFNFTFWIPDGFFYRNSLFRTYSSQEFGWHWAGKGKGVALPGGVCSIFTYLHLVHSDVLCLKQITAMYTYIHTVMAVTAVQGDNQRIRSSLGFSILPKDSLTCRPRGNRTSSLPITRHWLYPGPQPPIGASAAYGNLLSYKVQ